MYQTEIRSYITHRSSSASSKVTAQSHLRIKNVPKYTSLFHFYTVHHLKAHSKECILQRNALCLCIFVIVMNKFFIFIWAPRLLEALQSPGFF